MAMRFLSIELATTGTNPDINQILQIRIVLGDFVTSGVSSLPLWECVIQHKRIYGDPVALQKHAEQIEQIVDGPERFSTMRFAPSCEQAYYALQTWLIEHGFAATAEPDWRVGSGTVLVGSPDTLAFLRAGSVVWNECFDFVSTGFDIGTLYFDLSLGDTCPPELSTCLRRAGIVPSDTVFDVIRLLRNKYGMDPAGLSGAG